MELTAPISSESGQVLQVCKPTTCKVVPLACDASKSAIRFFCVEMFVFNANRFCELQDGGLFVAPLRLKKKIPFGRYPIDLTVPVVTLQHADAGEGIR